MAGAVKVDGGGMDVDVRSNVCTAEHVSAGVGSSGDEMNNGRRVGMVSSRLALAHEGS
jgi:hypothetical protein